MGWVGVEMTEYGFGRAGPVDEKRVERSVGGVDLRSGIWSDVCGACGGIAVSLPWLRLLRAME